MISCLLIQVSHNHQGLPVYTENIITGEALQIGRGAACKIHLPDHRVNLLHATVKRSEDGTMYIEGEKDVSININGFFEQSAALPPGTHVEIGPYLFVVETKPDTHDIALSVEMIRPMPHHDAGNAYPLTLADLGFSKRTLGFGLAACILFAFLLLPLLTSVSSAFDKWQSTLPVTLTDSWSPGPLSGGHRVFGAKCSTCHRHAFQPVSDEACKDCHKQVASHLPAGELHSITFKDVRCSSCHQDHRGKAGLIQHNSSICVACHADIKSKNTKTALANIHDFGADHPQFRLTLLEGNNVLRVRQDEKVALFEKSGLKYSHQVHLEKKGVSSPRGNIVMGCKDCHIIDGAGIHFIPMTMKQTCQQSRCHIMYFSPPSDGVVPHGSESEVMNRLRDFYAKWLTDSSVNNTADCSIADKAGNSAKRTLVCANELAIKNAASTLFREDGGNLECVLCHEIRATGDSEIPWKVTPLQVNHDYQQSAVFPHSRHWTINCTECHNKLNSKTSPEVSMPTIEKCRECHVGDHSVNGKITSACDSCHKFHQGGNKTIKQ